MHPANVEGIACVFTVLFQLLGLKIASNSAFNYYGMINGYNYNVVVYISILISSFAFYRILRSYFQNRESKVNHKLYFAFYILVYVFSFFYLFAIYCNETTKMSYGYLLKGNFLRESVNHFLFALLVSISAVGLVYMIIRNSQPFSKWFRTCSAAFFSIISMILSYAPNLFPYDNWGFYHFHAYINSIINVMHLSPYSDIASSIYGHYGLIYFPFVKLFGNDLHAIAVTIALFTGFIYLSAFYVLCKLIKNDLLCVISMLSVLATSLTFYCTGLYFQGMPHRCLFPMLTLAYITWRYFAKKPIVLLYFFDFVFGILSIVFNLETGLCCVFVIAIYNYLSNWYESVKNHVMCFIKSFFYISLCLVLAYVFVNLYNLIFGGEWNSVKTFIYPIASKQYDMMSILSLPLPPPDTPYSLYIIVFSFAAFSSFNRFLVKRKQDFLTFMELIVALSGLGTFIYFIYRTAPTNLFISHIQMILLLAVFSETFIKTDKHVVFYNSEAMVRVLASSLSIFLICWFAIEGTISFGNAITARNKSVWEPTSLKKDIIQFSKWMPKGIIAFGMGIPEIYYSLGLNSGVHVTDWTDMNDYSLKEVVNVLDKNNEVIVSEDTIKRVKTVSTLLEKKGFIEKDKFVGKNFSCILYNK